MMTFQVSEINWRNLNSFPATSRLKKRPTNTVASL